MVYKRINKIAAIAAIADKLSDLTVWNLQARRKIYNECLKFIGDNNGVLDDMIVKRFVYGVANKLHLLGFHQEQFNRIFGEDL